MKKNNEIGFYFGSFNPIHIGHLFVIKQALREGQVNKLYLIVSPQSPFKNIADLAPFDDRINMAKLAIAENHLEDKVEVVDWERDQYPSYTIDTLNHAKKLLGEDNEYTIFMGLDNFLSIDTWKCGNIILGEYNIHIIPRDCENPVKVISDKLVDLYEWYEKVKGVTFGNPDESISICATDIRKFFSKNQDLPKGLIPKSVEEYIKKKKLYII